LSGKGQVQLKLSGSGNECRSLVDGAEGAAAVEGGGNFGQEEAMTTLYELEAGAYTRPHLCST